MRGEKTVELKELTKDQIVWVYNSRLVEDFAPDEQKPLDVILKAVDNGIYRCLGAYDGSDLVGYTFLVRQQDNYLVDYLAIVPERRNHGIGSDIVRQLQTALADADYIIGEVEDPEYTADAAQKELQTRRIGFYLRNGCRDTGLRVRCFSVPFIILEAGSNAIKPHDELWEMYRSFYEAVMPPDMVKRNLERL